MGYKVTAWFLCLVLATVRATEMNLTKLWLPDIGWQITCSWKLQHDDSLQSVRLYNNDQQFMIYRPETNGDNRHLVYRRPEDILVVDCATSKELRRVSGTCSVTVELYQPQRNGFQIACEVSGERPWFRIDKKTIDVDAFVPPSNALVKVDSVNEQTGRVILNCTSSGLPSPNISWTIGEQKIPHDFTGSSWNATSKLWDVWSLLSYTPSSEHTALCTPEIRTKGTLVQGLAAEYNSAMDVKGALKNMFLLVIFPFLMR